MMNEVSNDSSLSFGDWLKRRRLLLGLNRNQFAEWMNCSVDLVKKIEAGKRRPVERFIVKSIPLLNIPIGLQMSYTLFARDNVWSSELEALSIAPPLRASDRNRTHRKFSLHHGQRLSLVVVEGENVRHKIVQVHLDDSECVLKVGADINYMLIKSKAMSDD